MFLAVLSVAAIRCDVNVGQVAGVDQRKGTAESTELAGAETQGLP